MALLLGCLVVIAAAPGYCLVCTMLLVNWESLWPSAFLTLILHVQCKHTNFVLKTRVVYLPKWMCPLCLTTQKHSHLSTLVPSPFHSTLSYLLYVLFLMSVLYCLVCPVMFLSCKLPCLCKFKLSCDIWLICMLFSTPSIGPYGKKSKCWHHIVPII